MTALDRVTETTAAYEATLALAETQRRDVIDAVVDALRRGEAPKDVAERSPWTARQLRDIRAAAELPKARAGRKPKPKSGTPSE
jgi:hypothetical protein